MQRFSDNATRLLFEGRDVLKDTMSDIILETCTSFVVAIIGYIDLRCRKQFDPILVLQSKNSEKVEDKEMDKVQIVDSTRKLNE